MPKVDRTKGLMTLEMFESILKKIQQETPNVAFVGLYNWAEPMIHPQLPEFLKIARHYGMPISLSTNFNTDRNLEEIVRAEPLSFRVSVSGFSQEFYGRTHTKGNIEKVKANMRTLREILDKTRSKIEVQIAYHCYRDNIGAEYESMKALCAELRFKFIPFFAYFMPLEKMLNFYEQGEAAMTDSDKKLMNLLAVHPTKLREISIRQHVPDCELRSSRTAINHDGSVALCCGVYENKHNIAQSFLEVSHEELQRRKYTHSLCDKCMKHGMHAASVYDGSAQWIVAARQQVAPQKLPSELIAVTHFLHWRQRFNKLIGVTTADKVAHFLRKLFLRT